MLRHVAWSLSNIVRFVQAASLRFVHLTKTLQPSGKSSQIVSANRRLISRFHGETQKPSSTICRYFLNKKIIRLTLTFYIEAWRYFCGLPLFLFLVLLYRQKYPKSPVFLRYKLRESFVDQKTFGRQGCEESMAADGSARHHFALGTLGEGSISWESWMKTITGIKGCHSASQSSL